MSRPTWTSVAVGSLAPPVVAALAGRFPAVAAPRLLRRPVGPADVIAPYDHVSNVVLGGWLDEIAAVVLGREATLAAGLAWFIARHEIDFRAETMRGDDLVAASRVLEIDRVRATCETLFLRARDGAALVESTAVWILVDLAARRPRRVPPDLVAALDPARVSRRP